LDAELAAVAKEDPLAQRLQQLRGVGPVVATALLSTLGNGEHFTKGRDFAVSLGLTPKQHSTGGKQRLLGISKRGEKRDDPLSIWVNRLAARRHVNVASVALANKTARIAWAIVRRGVDYDPQRAARPPT